MRAAGVPFAVPLAADGAPHAAVGGNALLALTVFCIAVIIVLIAWARMHPLLALILGSALLGLSSGIGAETTLTRFAEGLGGTVSDIGLLIALGAMLGQLLNASGAVGRLVDRFTAAVPARLMPWAIGALAFLVGLPLFFEVALVLVFPVVVMTARRTGIPLLRLAVPALASLSLLNGFLPPHPGPLLAVSAFDAELGTTLLYGLIVAVPTAVVGGPLLARLLSARIPSPDLDSLAAGRERDTPEDAGPGSAPSASDPGGNVALATAPAVTRQRVPGPGTTLGTMLLPVVLMLVRAVAEMVLPEDSGVRHVCDVVGEPSVALLAGCVLAMFTLGRGSGMSRRKVNTAMGSGLPLVASVILIVGAGGGFKSTLVATGVGDVIADRAAQLGLPALLLAWLVAALIRVAVGSGTVSIVTTAGLLAPLAAGMSPAHCALMALAVGAGSRFLSHVNDAGFWMVKEFLNLDVKTTFKTWTLLDCVVSVVAGAGVMVLSLVV
ncbi:gluconate:H+ symporter [Streptomyces olivaceus]|uniref:GntT/GntP/DsdX family permease n=1 Tax=Streptomyces TaxID=1883 RepID=UPI001FB77D7A|nr:gluconate:H+ symporter [Streptomyces sp. CB09030]UOG80516.1 GntP family permease [Streptomyces sp. CB09030]